MTILTTLNERYIALISADSNVCISLGLDQKLDLLPEKGDDYANKQIEAATALINDCQQALNDQSTQQFTEDQRIDIALIKLAAQQILLSFTIEINGFSSDKQLPQAGEQLSSGLFLLVTNDPRSAEQRLQNITARLQQAPKFLENCLAYYQTPVKRWVAIDCETIAGLPEFFASIISWAEQEDFSDIDQLKLAVDHTNAAITHYISALEKFDTTDNFVIGEAQANDILASRGIELSLNDIHQITCQYVDRTKAQIAQLQVELIDKYQLESETTVEQLQQFLHKKYAVKVGNLANSENKDFSQVITRYKQEADNIAEFIRSKQLFDIPDGQSMNIMQTPNFMAPMIPAGAMMQPPALRAGEKTSLIYLTLSDALLDEHNELGIPVMMIHEGIPGHHLQLATACFHPSDIRKTFPAMEYAEGWTTMLEDYMLDQGIMGELTQEARFIAKLDISRISARVAIDLYFMTGNVNYLNIGYGSQFTSEDVFENAGKLLKAVTGFTDARITGELNWYSQERGYPLSYLVGNHLVWQLKNDVVAKQQTKTPIEVDRLFHQAFLQAGNMPVAMLRQVFSQQGLL